MIPEKGETNEMRIVILTALCWRPFQTAGQGGRNLLYTRSVQRSDREVTRWWLEMGGRITDPGRYVKKEIQAYGQESS